MNRPRRLILLAVVLAVWVPATSAQEAPQGFREAFLAHFESASGKLLSLAEAMPAETYSWSPGEGVSSVAHVFMHVARYNYYYPSVALGVEVPPEVDLDALEAITEKEQVREQFRRSVEHVREAVRQMPDSQLSAPTRLYGRDVEGWGVLLQLLSHMNEHVGQSIAYARMNDVVPPWSR